ncbi:hypothetical protein [Nocardia sp. CC227C]|uniref:hypothetical protein n=1 Tax=Nocardia sp. CC227C TaxID=3044562 RepID=UPI00278C7E1E|nr:hypothetical protein [Nocardia sp. CC227C]
MSTVVDDPLRPRRADPATELGIVHKSPRRQLPGWRYRDRPAWGVLEHTIEADCGLDQE